jgi:GT2 family glycosyltransferase
MPRGRGSEAGVTVIVCAYTLERRPEVRACVESLERQTLPPTEIVIVVDHNEELAGWLATRLPEHVRIVENGGDPGLSASRNTGIGAATQPIVAFIDDDAVAEPDWLARLCAALSNSSVIGASGHSLPLWEGEPPAWFPEEFLWVVGCSYAGMTRSGSARNGLGGCMAFRAEVFERVGGFDPSIGRVGRRPVGGEETELCIRAQQRWPGKRIVVVEEATLHHRVPRERQQPAYFVRRCFHEGISKALIRRLGGHRALASEHAYATRTLPKAVLRELAAGLARRRPKLALQRGGAIVIGLAAAAAGFALESVAQLLRRPPRRSTARVDGSDHSSLPPFSLPPRTSAPDWRPGRR